MVRNSTLSYRSWCSIIKYGSWAANQNIHVLPMRMHWLDTVAKLWSFRKHWNSLMETALWCKFERIIIKKLSRVAIGISVARLPHLASYSLLGNKLEDLELRRMFWNFPLTCFENFLWFESYLEPVESENATIWSSLFFPLVITWMAKFLGNGAEEPE